METTHQAVPRTPDGPMNTTAQRPDTSSSIGSDYAPTSKVRKRKNNLAGTNNPAQSRKSKQKSFAGNDGTKESFSSKGPTTNGAKKELGKTKTMSPTKGGRLEQEHRPAEQRLFGEEDDPTFF